MKRILSMALLALVLGAGAASAASVSVSAGAFGGLSIPIVQEDAKQGPIYGLRASVGVLRLLALEPYWATTSLGDVEEEFGGESYTRDGGGITAYGLNALLATTGTVRFYPYVGIGSHKLTREATEDQTKVGYNFGLGVGFAIIPRLVVDARGELNVIVTDETSRKFGNVTLGVSYRFLGLP